ncbi:MAG: hypothetical protein KBT02_09445 [Treponema sp.]|nr:hypothetical protein [Candidatus Treponema caballi]
MKRRILPFFALLLFFRLSAEGYPFEGVRFQNGLDYTFSFTDSIYKITKINLDYTVTNIEGKYSLREENGYLIADVDYGDHSSEIFIFSADEKHIILYDNYLKQQIDATRIKGHTDEPWIWSVCYCTATSYLTELLRGETVEYVPDNFGNDKLLLSWVEGAPGNGIGEKIAFESVTNEVLIGSRRFYIINGFFSPDKPSLFFDNGRIKTFHVKCYDNKKALVYEGDVELEDTGKMQVIEFPVRCCAFEFEITDVYPGRKYEDTAITAIYVDALNMYEP